ncbi:hypothetical protein BU14_0074s0016 [Porphyra umbilicalis]|uniref:Core Histone H2A/H2B/H3 domain-containing protein n=1 Tax=Porphyra umbilicalis TaxID=2786 RepID=A0A1X6PFQ8_PORUM|nr:hypothetical protein BU14_0074s0016 [Porphyra umbilicalis]|eukprot:OSX79585.1 hypothetical protein BU14_0074s0016 [Porphyra umbilicalis]
MTARQYTGVHKRQSGSLAGAKAGATAAGAGAAGVAKGGAELFLPRYSFERLLKEAVVNCRPGLRLTAEAAYLVEGCEEAVLCAAHVKRVTVMVKDLALARSIRGGRGNGARC